MSNNYTSVPPSEYIAAGVLMTALGVIGMSINIAVILALIRTPLFHNAFGYLCILHLMSNAGELLVFSLWGGPATILQLDASITDTFLGTRIAQVYLFFWFCSLYSDLQLAVNRLIAIGWPLMYNKTFAGKRLIYFIGSFCILSFIHALVFSIHDCSQWFDTTTFSFNIRATTCGYIGAYYTVGAHVICVCALIFMIDTITLYCLWKRAQILRYSNGTQSEHERRMLKKNTLFYIQGCIQNIVLLLATLSYLVLLNFASTRLQVYLTSSLNWELAYMSYSIILVLFNHPLRKILSKPFSLLKRQSIITTTAAISHTSQTLPRLTQ